MHGSAVVVGVGESEYYKRGGSPHTEFQLACIAIRNAVADAGLTLGTVDGFVSYMDRNEPVRLSAALGVGDVHFTAQTFGGGGTGVGAAVSLAASASMSRQATLAPASAKTNAMARPMPSAAPTTIAGLPSRRKGLSGIEPPVTWVQAIVCHQPTIRMTALIYNYCRLPAATKEQ